MEETPEAPAPKMRPGSIGWIDMAAANHEAVRDFYRDVVGWEATPLSMGDHDDYCMAPPEGETVAGICKESGSAATGLPAVWMIYIIVADLSASLAKVAERGGAVHSGPKKTPMGDYAIVRDPAGAYCALFQPPTTPPA